MPSVIEIQEVSMIEKPGTLTRLNALFDDCAKTDLLIGVATHFSCPIITLVVCHRINRYNDMGTEKGKGFRTLIFCTELSPETITKTMVIISKYEVEYKETEDIFNRQ